MSRLPTRQSVIKRLFALSGNKCAFPGCNETLIDDDGDLIGHTCHIEAAEIGGERYNENQTDEERRSFGNLLLLCYMHHVKTNDVLKYPVSIMVKMKADHEARYVGNEYTLPKEIEDKIVDQVVNKLDEIHRQITEVQTAVVEGNEVAAQTNAAAMESLELLRKLTSSSTISSDDSKIYSEQLAFIKELRSNGKSQTALDALVKFKEEKWNEINDELKYKVLANLASILFEFNKTNSAADYLLQLEEVNYKTEDSLAFLCLGYAIKGEKVKFEETSLLPELKGNLNSNFWVGYIHLYKEFKSADEIREGISAEMLQKPEILYTLGEVYLDKGDVNVGFEMLQQSMEAGSGIDKNWQGYALIATKKLNHLATMEKVAFKGFKESEIKQIEECISELTKAWDYVASTELVSSTWYIIMNRGIAYKIVGDKINAELDFYEAWRLSKKYITFRNLILHYFDTNQYEKAAKLLSEADILEVEGRDKVELATLSARLSSLTNNHEEAVSILDKQAQLESGKERLHLLDLITVTYFECGAFSKALPYAEQIILEYGDLPHGYLSAAICYRREGDVEKSRKAIEACFERANKHPESALIWYQLGMEFYSMKIFDRAAHCFEKVPINNSFNEVSRVLILAHFHSGNYERAEELGIVAKTAREYDPGLNEVLFRIYEATGQDEKVLNILGKYLLNGEDQAKDHFRLLGIKYFKGKGEEKKPHDLLMNIEDATRYSLVEQFIVSRYLLEYGEIEKGLSIAYNARLNNYEKGDTHQYYITTVAGRPEEKEEEMFPLVVGMDNAIELTDKVGTVNTYFITDDKRLSGPNILRSVDPLSKKLIGQNLGYELTMDNSVGIGNVLRISAIMNRHVYAFRDSMSLIEKKFAGESGMVVFHPGNGDFMQGLKDYLAKNNAENTKKREKIFSIYNSGGAMTMGMLAHYFRFNMVELWLAMIGENATGIVTYMQDEAADLKWSIANDTAIVIDITALLTVIALLDKKPLLESFSKYIVAQSTIDELRQYRSSITKGSKMSIVVEDGELRKVLFGQEEIEAQQRWVDKIIEWCEKNATVISPKKSMVMDSEKANVYEMIGQPAYDSLLLAEEWGATVLSDDEKFKTYALGEHRLRSFSSYQLLAYQTNEKKITDKEYSNLCKVLMRANYVLIPVSGIDLWDMYVESGFQIKPPFTRASRGIKILSNAYAAQTISTFGKQVYLNVTLKESRTYVLQYVLGVLKGHNHATQIKPILLAMIERDFYLLPGHLLDFKSLILDL